MIHKSRQSLLLLLFTLAAILSGCRSDDTQLPPNLLEGMINGESWEYKSANGYLISSDFRYQVRFLSSEELTSDPCAAPSPTFRHVRAIFRPAEGSFFVAPEAIDPNQAKVSFELSTSETLIASSGFMEVYAIDNRIIYGYLQAVLDEDNVVEGSFEIRLCN